LKIGFNLHTVGGNRWIFRDKGAKGVFVIPQRQPAHGYPGKDKPQGYSGCLPECLLVFLHKRNPAQLLKRHCLCHPNFPPLPQKERETNLHPEQAVLPIRPPSATLIQRFMFFSNWFVDMVLNTKGSPAPCTTQAP
jgi:hypothetical protein